MKVSTLTRETLRVRRTKRDLELHGFEEIGERGGKLWELHRGGRTDHVITDVEIGPDGKTLFIRTAPK